MPELGGCLFSAAVHAYFTNRLLRAVHAHLPVRQGDFSRRSRDTDLRDCREIPSACNSGYYNERHANADELRVAPLSSPRRDLHSCIFI
jgi:hypothetical protein